MSETLTHTPGTPPEASRPPEVQPVVPEAVSSETIEQNIANREKVVKDLLGVDYDYAKETGLVDMFYYDPVTGEDGLAHTLGGNLHTNTDGMTEATGFHHEPSGESMWPTTINPETKEVQFSTRALRQHLESLNNKGKEPYREYPLEPYRSQVAIGGYTKYAQLKKGDQVVMAPARNSMFPKEYDVLPVLQSIRTAMNDPERTVQSTVNEEGIPVTVVQGNAKLMDGKTAMPVRMVLDAETGKIRTAIPMVKNRPGYMKLTPEQAAAVPFDPTSYEGGRR